MNIKKPLEKINKKYEKKPRPTTLREACLMSIEKWEEVIDLIINNKRDYYRGDIHFSHQSCGLCRFFEVDSTKSKWCYECPLKKCRGWGIFQDIIKSSDPNIFVSHSYKLIKKIRKRYYKITGEKL